MSGSPGSPADQEAAGTDAREPDAGSISARLGCSIQLTAASTYLPPPEPLAEYPPRIAASVPHRCQNGRKLRSPGHPRAIRRLRRSSGVALVLTKYGASSAMLVVALTPGHGISGSQLSPTLHAIYLRWSVSAIYAGEASPSSEQAYSVLPWRYTARLGWPGRVLGMRRTSPICALHVDGTEDLATAPNQRFAIAVVATPG